MFLGLLAGACALVPSCKPDFGERESLVDRTQVLAVTVDPPEAPPGELVKTSMLVVSPNGTIEAPPTGWAFCLTPKLLIENGAVSAACLANVVAPIGDARGGVTAQILMNACFQFGPETQSADVRPRDPDITGGFFLPIRARLDGDPGKGQLTAFGFARLVCNLGNAPADLAAAFKAQYKANKNPTLSAIEAHLEGLAAPAALDAIPRGAHVVLRASWRPEDAEVYALYDIRNQAIVTKRESMRVSWFTTAGSFDVDRSGRTEDEMETFTENTWTAPDDARTTHLWFVLRDARGGVAFSSATVTTR
jgi:hypothetical protein